MHVVIIGLGHAGMTAITQIRHLKPETQITVITEETHPFYFRPQLFDVVSGTKTPDEIVRYSTEWYLKNKIDLHLKSRVIGINPSSKELQIEQEQNISYDKLLITTGAKPFIPPIPGIKDVKFFCLRHLEDAKAIIGRARASTTKEATIIGGGLLGLELAKGLSDRGLTPTIVETAPYLLPRQLDAEGGIFIQRMLNQKFRFKFILNAKCESLKQENDSIVIKINNTTHVCDFLLFSAGVRPQLDLASAAGIKVNKGILVDRLMQTNIKDIYAAGDIAEVDFSEFPGNAWGIVPPAVDQAKVAANNICDQETQYMGTLPWTTLKIVGIDLTSIGQITTENTQQFKECDYNKLVYRKLFLKDNKIRGAILLGTKEDLPKLRILINQKTTLEEVKKAINFELFMK